MTNNINDSVNTEEMSQEAQCVNQVHQQGTPNKEIKPKEKEDRIRLLREKQEMEIEKRKREIEENLKRKQELREKQMLERKKRLDEMKSKEMERRHAVEERRKQREQMNRLRMSEMLKKEQEREIQRVDLAKLASKFSAERPKTRESVNNQVITSLNEPNLNLSSSLLVSSSSNTSSNFNSYNKSQSVYNLSHKNSLHK